MAAADLPDHADVAPASVEPAIVPQRHSLFGAQRRLSADSGAESVPSSQDPASSGASAPSAASAPAGVSAGPASPSTSPASAAAAADQARPVDPWAAGSASLSEPDHSAPAHQPAPDAWGAPSEPSWQSLSGGGSGAGSPGAWSAPSTPSWQSVGCTDRWRSGPGRSGRGVTGRRSGRVLAVESRTGVGDGRGGDAGGPGRLARASADACPGRPCRPTGSRFLRARSGSCGCRLAGGRVPTGGQADRQWSGCGGYRFAVDDRCWRRGGSALGGYSDTPTDRANSLGRPGSADGGFGHRGAQCGPVG